MIKGVNKNIIEVANTGNRYFDKAILFVKPEYNAEPADKLKAQAKLYLNSVGIPAAAKKQVRANMRKSEQMKKTALWLICGAALLIIAMLYFKYA